MPQDPFVFNQDPGENSSQSAPYIDHQCCYRYCNSLDGIFCQQCTCESCGNGAHYGYNCSPKVLIIFNPEPCHNQNVDEFPQTLSSFHPTCYSGDENSSASDSTPNFVNDSPNVFNPPSQTPTYSNEFCGNDTHFSHDCPPQIPLCYDDDDDEENSTPLRDIIISELPSCIAITPVLSTKETKDSLIMGDEHLDAIPEKESDEFIKSSVENLVPNLNSSIISSSKIDSLLDEFAGELIFLKSIPLGIDEADCDPEEEIRLIEKLLYDNSSPRPSEEFNYENYDAVIESFSPSPILVEDSDPFMKEIDLFLTSDGSIPPGIDSDYSNSEGDILFLERLRHDDHIPLSDILDSSNVVRIFPPLFTYPMTSSILLSSRSEDTIFDPGISDCHFSSFMPDVSHQSGTFMKFNVYPNHLNESPIEILSSTCSPVDQ
uniref:Reverse transcriptase domain-containing protein n=1 Tax=Tanacetum cinerariifolium TaxID=118510 RepID=A0A6L2LL15_TANCI|nr:hypothetical protein [Tanacetum cinerariifolium]